MSAMLIGVPCALAFWPLVCLCLYGAPGYRR
jgi:hypothetical protein